VDQGAAGGGGGVALSDRPRRTALPRNVRALAAVSFLTDVSSEIIYPLLPLFLSTVLGVSAATLGLIEGLAESVASLLRLPAGWLSDRLRRRTPFVWAGYALSTVARPLLGLAQGAGHVVAIRLSDRFGKGIRSAPRDALIADAVAVARRGRAFGFHRAADNLGAMVGPLIAWAVLSAGIAELRTLFLWTAVPGFLALVVLVAFVREEGATGTPLADAAQGMRPARGAARSVEVTGRPAPTEPLGGGFWRYLGVILLFTLSLSTDAFLLLRASHLGVPVAMIPILWATLHAVKSSTSLLGGALSDRVGRRPVILGGWCVYAAVYLGFALAQAQWQAWALFMVYGVYFGMTEGVEKALVADLVPASRRGAAYGWYHAAVGLAALPASVIFGLVWQRASPEAAFMLGAAIAAGAALLFAVVVPGAGRPAVR
jgi:MFS family permease